MRASRRFNTALVLCALTALPASADCPFDWRSGEGIPGVNGVAYATTRCDSDGPVPIPELLIVGGDFAIAGGWSISHRRRFCECWA